MVQHFFRCFSMLLLCFVFVPLSAKAEQWVRYCECRGTAESNRELFLVFEELTSGDKRERKLADYPSSDECNKALINNPACKAEDPPPVPPVVTRCYAQAYYTGEICCSIQCISPKVARCRNPSHPSFCRSAVCYCQ